MLFSVCLPSNRPLSTAKASIVSAVNYCQAQGYELVISDNSGDPAKEAFVRSLSFPALQYLKADGYTATENLCNAISKADGEFIAFFSDDDILTYIHHSGTSLPLPSPEIAGYRQNMALSSPSHGIVRVSSWSIEGQTAKDRVVEYLQKNQGANTSLFSFFRKTLFVEVHDLFAESHPTNAGYHDWAFVLALMSSGKLLADHSSLLIYNLHNWESPESADRSLNKLFSGPYFKATSKAFLPIFQGLDSFIGICRQSSPVSREERLEAAIYALTTYLNGFLKTYKSGSQQGAFTDTEKSAIENLTRPGHLKDILDSTLKLVEAHSPALVDPYLKFYKRSLGTDWGLV